MQREKLPYQKVLDFLDSLPPQKGFIYHHYASSGSKHLSQPRMYFSDENAAKIDAIRMQIQSWKEKGHINESEYFIFLCQCGGVYAAFCKKWNKRALKPFQLKEIEILPSDIKYFCYCGDGIEMLKSLESKQVFDILYLDPPYNHRQYAPNYHLIETIAKYDNPKIKGVAGLREWQHQKSAFCNTKTALIELEKIIKLNNYKHLVLSYNSKGLMQKSQIDEILKPLGKVIFESFSYPRFKSNANKGNKYIREYLWIVQRF